MSLIKKKFKILLIIVILFLIIFLLNNNSKSKYDLNESSYPREGNEINFHVKDYKKIDCDLYKNHISFLIFGQSNAANFLKFDNNNFINNDNLMFFENECFLIEDKVLGSTGSYSSLWNIFASKTRKIIGDKKHVLIIPKAIGGTSVSDWSNNKQDIFTFLLNEIENYENNFSKPLDYIILIIGETDGYNKTTEENYMTDISDIFEKIYLKSKYNSKPNIFMTLTSKCYDNESNYEILNAQRKFSNLNENIEIFTLTDNLGTEYRWDNCHYNKRGAEYITDSLIKKIFN